MNLPKLNLSILQGRYFLLPAKYKALGMLTVTITLVVALSLTIGKAAFDQVMNLRNEIATLSQENQVLQSKSQVLSSVDQNELSRQAQSSLLAVPSDTPSLPTLLSLRTIAVRSGVVISDFKVSEKKEKGQDKGIEIQISVGGSLPGVLGFLDEIKNYPPVMRVVNANISYTPTGSLARITIDSLYAPVPADLGKVQSPLEALKATDLEIVKEFEEFNQFTGTTVVPAASVGKTNPFE